MTAVSPDCSDRFKHAACSGGAWDFDLDVYAPCTCPCHEPGRPLTAYDILGILPDDGRTTQQIIDEERK